MHLLSPPPNFAITKSENTMKTLQMNEEESSKLAFSAPWILILSNAGFNDRPKAFRPSLLGGMLSSSLDQKIGSRTSLLAAGAFLEIRNTLTSLSILLPEKASRWLNLISSPCVVLLAKNRRVNDPDAIWLLTVPILGLALVFRQVRARPICSFRPANSTH